MERSMTSMNKAFLSNSEAKLADHSIDEESSWTCYFEDLSCSNDNEHSCFSSGHESPSLVSDAASSSVKKLVDNDLSGEFALGRSGRNLSFKKRRTKGTVVDDVLEDTASSPVNSPKVCYFNEMGMEGKDQKAITEKSEEKGNTNVQTDERTDLGALRRDGDDCTELRKRGLCLVSVNMFANYI